MSQDGDHRGQGDEGGPPPTDADVAARPDPATTTRWRMVRDWIRQTSGASDRRPEPPEPEAKESTQAP